MPIDLFVDRLASGVFRRSLSLYDSISEVIQSQRGYSFKSIFSIFNRDFLVSKSLLLENSIKVGVFFQNVIISDHTDRVSEICGVALFKYLSDKFPSETRDLVFARLNDLYRKEMPVMGDIYNMVHPLHYGETTAPSSGYLADNLYYRFSVWILENSLTDPMPHYNIELITKIVVCLTDWYVATALEIKSINFTC